jgi:UDPglucose 6-dehydrogenase
VKKEKFVNKIAVIGAGYVGLVTGVCFAQKGNFVVIVERDEEKIETLLQGKVPFYEPGLDQLLSFAVKNKRVVFVKDLKIALEYDPQIIFSCVGTPSMPDGSADLSAVWAVAREVGKSIHNYCLFVNKSTVPVGTVKKVERVIREEINKRALKITFDVASNPEFLKEGAALQDFLLPDRVVVGVRSKKAKRLLKSLYNPFLNYESQFLVMNPESAELTKYASNAMLATRISFMNQLANLADIVGADIASVRLGMSKDKRIGKYFLNAGVGYGGSCFPKDVKALVHIGKNNNCSMTLINEVENINNKQRIDFADKILAYYKNDIKNKMVGIWGLAFKPETDDIRCAPSIDIINRLLEHGAKIIAYDAVATANIKKIFGNKVLFSNKAQEVLNVAHCLVVLTEWKEFLNYDINSFLILKDKVIFDGRNCLNPISMKNLGITYFNIGRNCVGNECDKKEKDSLYSSWQRIGRSTAESVVFARKSQ